MNRRIGMTKKGLSLLLAMIISLGAIALTMTTAFAEQSDLSPVSTIASGVTGDCKWTLEDHVLTISGSGKMADYDGSAKETSAPWRYMIVKKAVIESGVTHLSSYAFDAQYTLDKVTIPDTLSSIGNNAFRFCREITQLNLPNSVTEIGEDAFSGCKGFSSFKIPKHLKAIENGVFYSCIGLTHITIPDGVETIGRHAFYNCTALTSVSIPDSVTEIGEQAFNKCESLTRITIPKSVTAIGDHSLGYNSYQRINGFNIYGTKGSAAELYAKSNNFTFFEGVAPKITYVGDPDGDERVTIIDATLIQMFLVELNPEPFDEAVADVDGSGQIEIIDATFIQRHLAGLSAPERIGQPMGMG